MSRILPFAACAALLLSLAAAAPGTPTTIRWANGKITRIGALDLSRTPTIKRATDAFGQPTSKRLSGKVLCVVDWRGLRLRGNFVNLGGPMPGRTTCSTSVGKLQTAEIRGRALQTQAGLRVGDSLARLRRLHPGARRHGTTWWLATAPNVFGANPRDRIPIVRANVRAAKVSALVLWIGAAGE